MMRMNFVVIAMMVLCGVHVSRLDAAFTQVAPSQTSTVTLSISGARNQTREADGTVVYEAEPGQRLKMSVTCTGAGTGGAKPTIDGADAFQVISAGQSSNMVNYNGRVSSTVKFEYYLECKDEGSFTIGPARLGNYVSNACSIRVRQRTQQEADRDFEHDYKRGVACQARLVLEKDSFFLGEDISVSLDVYCWDPGVEIEAVQPTFEGFTVKEQPHTVSTISIDNRDVRMIQKKYILSTMWPGVKKIKPVSLIYKIPVSGIDDDFPFGMMQGGFFFGPHREVKQAETRTNGLEFTIKELPQSDRTPDGIGSFSSLKLSLDKNSVSPRTPLNLTLKLSGKSDLSQVTAPRLRLPKGVRSFPGTTESDIVKNDGTGEFEKKFTYVIQPLKAGTLKIPAQEFLYFDPEAGQYKTLMSQETMIVVESDESEASAEASTTAPSQQQFSQQTPEAQPDQGSEQAIPERKHQLKVPWTLWYLLVVMALVFGLLYEKLMQWFTWYHRNPRRALTLALKALEQPGKNEADQLFGIAVEYFALRFFNDQKGALPLESIEAVLEEHTFPASKRAEFMKFLTSLAALAFASSRIEKQRVGELREMLKKWLTEIDSI